MYSWNEAAWGALQSRPNGLPGTLLLAGPAGVGKRSFAQALAQGSLCANRIADGKPCGACASCRLFASGSHPDFRLLEPAATRRRAETDPMWSAAHRQGHEHRARSWSVRFATWAIFWQ